MQYNFHLVPLFSGVINLVLSAFVLFINPRRRLNQIFWILGFGLAWWNFGTFALSMIKDGPGALSQVRLNLIAAIFLPAAFYHFAIESESVARGRWKVLAAYIVAGMFLCSNFTPLFISGVRAHYHFYRPTGGPAFWAFCFVFYPILAYGTLSALFRFIKVAPPAARRSAKILLGAVSLLFLSGIHDMLPVLGLDYYPGTEVPVIVWGTLGASLYGFLIGYSVLSDQLLDVRISISRHAATALRLSFFGGLAYIMMLAVGAMFPGTFTGSGLLASLVILIASAVVSATFFPKLFGRITGRLEQGVLGDHFEYQDKVNAFVDSPRDWENVQKLLEDTAALVYEQLNLSAIGVAIVSGDKKMGGQSILDASERMTWSRLLAPDSTFISLFKTTEQTKLDRLSDFNESDAERSARAVLVQEGLELALPISPRPKVPIGILITGPRRDGRAMTKLDIELLAKLCQELADRVERIAILQNEELRQASNAKDRFLASINHEIRNPLNGITGIVDMLRENERDPRSKFLLSTLRSCTDQLKSTMDDVLDFTRIEAGTVTLTVSDIDIAELVKTTCAGFDIAGKRVVAPPDTPTVQIVRCDTGKVRQILSNYIGNSLKYGVPSGAAVALSATPIKDDLVEVIIEVTSTGPTLSQEELGVLFTALTRGRRARETNAHGTGLGLALCKKLAHAMNGTVGVRSSEGATTFWFRAEFPQGAVADPANADTFARFTGIRVLAIEDEPYNRLVLGHYLSKLRVGHIWAETGQAAISAAREQEFDVILMDWLLPDMDGAELMRKMRATRAATTLPPVIVLSAYSTMNKRAECLAVGAHSFISKPIDLEKLSAAFDSCDFRSRVPKPTEFEPTNVAIDLSSLIALGKETLVIRSFVREIREGRSRLATIWQTEPESAALLAHRLKAQMTLIRAKDCASLLEVLEQALNEKWSPGDIRRLIDSLELDVSRIADLVELQESRLREIPRPAI